MPDGRYTRASRVLWRAAHDRVIVRVPRSADADTVEADLAGAAAVVWLALDTPRTEDELVADLAEAGSTDASADTARALALLRAHGLLDGPGELPVR